MIMCGKEVPPGYPEGMWLNKMNRTPQRNLGWAFSIDVTRELLANDGGRAS